ncbi:MAG TPA: N-acetyltransferase [Candidatus Dorea intestinavium]|nr:N-acetyltransferase [Candidatus Dorea intestinavium]
MKIKHAEDEKRFVLMTDDNDEAGELGYKIGNDGLIYATYTRVDKMYEGMGHARLLLEAFVEWLRANDKKVYPTCPYVAAVFEKSPQDYSDIVSEKYCETKYPEDDC